MYTEEHIIYYVKLNTKLWSIMAKKDLKFSFRCILPYGQLYIERNTDLLNKVVI